jgi:hypothetical protein
MVKKTTKWKKSNKSPFGFTITEGEHYTHRSGKTLHIRKEAEWKGNDWIVKVQSKAGNVMDDSLAMATKKEAYKYAKQEWGLDVK